MGKETTLSAFKQAQLRHRRPGGESPDPAVRWDELVDFSASVRDERIVVLSMNDKIQTKQGCNTAAASDSAATAAHANNSTDSDFAAKCYQGPTYGLSGFPGFVYCPQALAASLQLDLAYLAVSEYCQAPHATNIDGVPPKPTEDYNPNDSMWDLWKQDQGLVSQEKEETSVTSIRQSPTDVPKNTKKRKMKRKRYKSFEKLSWATLGYHYDWTLRAYHEGAKSSVPTALAQLVQFFAATSLRLEHPNHQNTLSYSFTPSAMIVNYYHTKSIMGGHQDDLEWALDKPVVSVSVGLAAIFLLGGLTKESPVMPILVRPGDVLMLGGPSRLCYHGMARVLPPSSSCPPPGISTEVSCQVTWKDVLDEEVPPPRAVSPTDQEALRVFLQQHRININARQVLPDGVPGISERLSPSS